MDLIGRSVQRCKAGTITKPPPTPNNPDNRPAAAPDKARASAHGEVQTILPVCALTTQGGRRCGNAFCEFCG